MKHKKSASKAITQGRGEHPDSRKRWWNEKVDQDEKVEFQHFQFDPDLSTRLHPDKTLSPKGMADLYGDNSLQRHVEKLLYGIHESLIKTP